EDGGAIVAVLLRHHPEVAHLRATREFPRAFSGDGFAKMGDFGMMAKEYRNDRATVLEDRARSARKAGNTRAADALDDAARASRDAAGVYARMQAKLDAYFERAPPPTSGEAYAAKERERR